MKELNELCDLMDNLYPVIKNEIKDHIFPSYITKIIEILDSIDYKKYESETICAICQEDIISGTNIPTLKCDHPLHVHCLIKYYFSGCNTCPTCRCELYEVPDFDVSGIHNIDLLQDRVKKIFGIRYRTTKQGRVIQSNTLYKRSCHYDPTII